MKSKSKLIALAMTAALMLTVFPRVQAKAAMIHLLPMTVMTKVPLMKKRQAVLEKRQTLRMS